MPERRISINELLADLDGLQVSLDEDDGHWSCTAKTKLLGQLDNVPAETIALAFEDLGGAIERRICEVMLGQLTDYQVAVLLGTLVVDHNEHCDWKRFQPAPMSVAGVAVEMLDKMGLMVCKGDSRRFVDYGALGVSQQSSGFTLTTWGEALMGELRGSKRIDRAPVVKALAKIRRPAGVKAATTPVASVPSKSWF